MVWRVWLTASVRQGLKKLPKGINEIFQLLLAELGLSGPVQKDWPHYGKLRQDCYYCHLKRGRPTYVAIWRVLSKKDRLMEVTYVGSHEKARYDKLC
jgi:mRNA-degrading endonuclease RelE of RelBE toxin-antitoxin system